jgi:hypothetical protein
MRRGELHLRPRYFDFDAIRLQIEQETLRTCGPRGVSTKAILLDIYSPEVVDLTLVDLPGAVRVASEGQDQVSAHDTRGISTAH